MDVGLNERLMAILVKANILQISEYFERFDPLRVRKWRSRSRAATKEVVTDTGRTTTMLTVQGLCKISRQEASATSRMHGFGGLNSTPSGI